MLKKVLLVALCLMIASASFAQVSGPSNVAGYVKFGTLFATPGVAAATPFGLPFLFWDVAGGVPTYGVESTSPSDIIGDQAAMGDAITSDKLVRQGGDQAYRLAPAGTWTGLLEDNAGMIPGQAYWYVNKTGAARDIVLAGEVDNAGNYGTTTITDPPAAPPGLNNATPYSWRDSRNVPVELLGLLAAGFTGGDVITSDKIVEQGGAGGIVNYLTATNTWAGGFAAIAPGTAYWLVNKHPGNPFDYTYVGEAVLPLVETGSEGVITSTRTSVNAAKDNVRSSTSVRAPQKLSKDTPDNKVDSQGGKTKGRTNK